jgi:uncharacterized membrane protein YkvI
MGQYNDKTHLLYAVGLGLLLSDLIPTPADSVYFYLQQKNKEKLEKKEITPKQYWTKDAVNYYGLNALWWGGVLITTHYIGSGYEQKRNLLIGLIGAGAVFSVLSNNIKKDEEFYKYYNK